jgi:hypothetical protein
VFYPGCYHRIGVQSASFSFSRTKVYDDII